MNRYFASVPRHLEDLAALEAERQGALNIKMTRGGVYFQGGLDLAYGFCLWTRVSSRVLLFIDEFEADGEVSFFRQLLDIPWESYFSPQDDFLCHMTGSGQGGFSDRFALLKLKDAIVDRFRDKEGVRPNVNRENPSVRIEAHRSRNRYSLYLDLSGESLHRRGYRRDKGGAALRENTAAALLYRAGWDSPRGESFLDPMCGSGTLCIEAAMIAADRAPALERTRWGFRGWKGHDEALWLDVHGQAVKRYETGRDRMGTILGYDRDPSVISKARSNFNRSGMKGVRFEAAALEDLILPDALKEQEGLIAVNPPYGIRLEERVGLEALYRRLGAFYTDQLPRWRLAVITPDKELGMALQLRLNRENKIDNGGLECLILHFVNPRENRLTRSLSPAGEQFKNRLKKNLKRLGKWARKQGVTSYRLYDADMPDYNFAIDWYEGKWIHFQEYAPTVKIDQKKAEKRVKEALDVINEVLEVERSAVFIKTRRRQKGVSQYEKKENPVETEKLIAREEGRMFLINMTDYLDTGLFLDHRPIRKWIGENSRDKDFLNLFAYTGSATVHAAAGGARSTVTVDGSKTYTAWARENLAFNRMDGPEHRFVCADCFTWLEEEEGQFDLIFMDPPTFSNSKGRKTTFDIQKDHPRLIGLALARLRVGGTLVFSNNYRKFQMEFDNPSFRVKEISSWTVPEDFKNSKGIHRCWLISYDSPGT